MVRRPNRRLAEANPGFLDLPLASGSSARVVSRASCLASGRRIRPEVAAESLVRRRECDARNLFLSERHPVSRRVAVFKDDGTSAWLYLCADGMVNLALQRTRPAAARSGIIKPVLGGPGR